MKIAIKLEWENFSDFEGTTRAVLRSSGALGKTEIWGPYKQIQFHNFAPLTCYSLGIWMIFLSEILKATKLSLVRNLGAPKNRGPWANV